MTTDEQKQAAVLTPGRLISIKRLMDSEHWNDFWSLMKANFCLDEPVFEPDKAGHFDPLRAAKKDGQRDVMNFIRAITKMQTPSADEETIE